MNQQFKCPNCGEDSMHIVKSYKMTESDNYLKCGRCLHVWMTKKNKFKDWLIDTILLFAVGIAISGLLICYIERWWFAYFTIIALVMILSLANYFMQVKKK